MHLLPLTLGVVADHADPKEGARWATTGVRLELSEGRFTAVATDTKQLLEVSGPVVADAAEYPTWPALEQAPNGATQGLIPLKTWRAFFATAKKKTPKRTTRPELRSVAVKLSPHEATLACTDTEATPTETTRLVEGRFPPTDQVWPKGAPLVTVALNPAFVAQAAKTLAVFADEDDDTAKRMTVELRGPTKPVVLRVEKADGTVARALVMPLGGAKELSRAEETAVRMATEKEDSAEVARLTAALDRLRGELGDMTEQRNQLAREVYEAKKELAGSVRDAAEQSAEKHAALEKVAELERANADLTRRVGAGIAKPARKPRGKKGAAPVEPVAPSSAEKAERFTCGEFLNNVFAFLGAAVSRYEKSAPTVSAHADETYRRLIDGAPVTWLELAQLLQLKDESLEWEQPNLAANRVYKLRHSLGMDVTGHAGF